MQDVLHQWQRFYYGEPIVMLFQIVAILYTIKKSKHESIAYLFFAYTLTDLLFFIINTVLIYNGQFKSATFWNYVDFQNTFIAIAEATIYYKYFKTLYYNKNSHRWLGVIFILILATLSILILTRFSFINNRKYLIGYSIESIQLLFLTVLATTYYYQLFKVYKKQALVERPSFWIMTGVFIYSIISIPYYLIHPFLLSVKFPDYEKLTFLFFYMPMIINFLFISKAMNCKHSITI